MILIDTNVLLDLFAAEADSAWARRMLARFRDEQLAVNAVIRAEFAPRFADLREQDRYLSGAAIRTVPLDMGAAFRAGIAFREYRRRGGKRDAILADFLIGGHAAALGAALMTRDRGRFSSYFPDLNLITPETEHG